MKYCKNSVFSAAIAILIFILKINYIKGATIKCSDCTYVYAQKKCQKDGIDCPSYCRPHFYRGQCYDCSLVFKNDVRQLYLIVDGACANIENSYLTFTTYYIISETNEFVKESNIYEENRSSNVYVFGYFVYKQCPEGTTVVDKIVSSDKTMHLCRCSSLTYSIQIFKKSHYKCVSSCPNGYYQNTIEMDVCQEKCDNDHPKIKVPSNECVSNCKIDGYYFAYTDNGNQYCSNRCPSSAPFYYPRDGDNEVICRNKCLDNDFYFSNSKICTQKCSGHKSLIDIENSIFICDETLQP